MNRLATKLVTVGRPLTRTTGWYTGSSVNTQPATGTCARSARTDVSFSGCRSCPPPRPRQVWENSPANQAGLKIGDKVLQFGTVTRGNKSAQTMTDVVRNSVGKPLKVT